MSQSNHQKNSSKVLHLNHKQHSQDYPYGCSIAEMKSPSTIFLNRVLNHILCSMYFKGKKISNLKFRKEKKQIRCHFFFLHLQCEMKTDSILSTEKEKANVNQHQLPNLFVKHLKCDQIKYSRAIIVPLN